MQWVVTTGRTVAEARDRALDALGIHEDDLEVEVVSEPSTSLFGLRKHDATIRARVRPTRPRPKVDRRNRRNKRDGRRRKTRGGTTQDTAPAPNAKQRSRAKASDTAAEPRPAVAVAETGAPTPPESDNRRPSAPKGRDRSPSEVTDASSAPTPSDPKNTTRSGGSRGAPMSDIPLSEQEPTAVEFVKGLVEAFGAEASVESEHLEEDDAIEIRVEGDDLGLLVGQRGNTLSSISELTRTAVAQQHSGRLEGRLRVDVAGYRARRKEALERFVAQVADKVLDSGSAVALEPMSPPDRKIVHDAANEIDGVHTSSRGEDRRRHVVIHPDD